VNIPQPTSGSGFIPEIEDGLFIADFTTIEPEEHPDWAVEKDSFGKPDDGRRFRWYFTILDDEGAPAIAPNAEDPDDELVLHALTRNMSNHEKSNATALMKGLCSPAEFKLWETGDVAALVGAFGASRRVHVKVAHSEKGYPQIEATLGPVKAKAGK